MNNRKKTQLASSSLMINNYNFWMGVVSKEWNNFVAIFANM